MIAFVILLLAYAYSCGEEVEPNQTNALSGYCNLLSIAKATPITHATAIGYFIIIIIQIVGVATEDNSPFKVGLSLL